MIEIIDDVITIPNWNKHQSLDAYERKKERDRILSAERRAKQKLLITESPDVRRLSDDCQTTVAVSDKEKEEDKRKRNKSVVETTHALFERLSSDYSLSEELKEKMAEWVKYKTERKETYKEQGMKSLLKQVERKASAFGDKAICELIDECMANGWKGIIFERIKNAPAKVESTFETDDFFEAALARSYRGE
jgi:hypothetical protein